MDYASNWALRARRVGQSLGILRPTVRLFRRLTNHAYEEAFDHALMSEIRQGDVVWDIGAIVGVYTARFANAVGVTGRVLAFEPSPAPLDELKVSCGALPNVEIVNVALSDTDGEAEFWISDLKDSVTNSFSAGKAGTKRLIVPTARGDRFRDRASPSIVKVDVEGFELDVLRGMREVLRSPSLRAIFIEVHFLASTERGEPEAPRKLVELLREAELSYRWVDPSHLVATRV